MDTWCTPLGCMSTVLRSYIKPASPRTPRGPRRRVPGPAASTSGRGRRAPPRPRRHVVEVRTPLLADVDGRSVQRQDAVGHRLIDARSQRQGVLTWHPEQLEDAGPVLDREGQLLLEERLALARRLPDLREVVPL